MEFTLEQCSSPLSTPGNHLGLGRMGNHLLLRVRMMRWVALKTVMVSAGKDPGGSFPPQSGTEDPEVRWLFQVPHCHSGPVPGPGPPSALRQDWATRGKARGVQGRALFQALGRILPYSHLKGLDWSEPRCPCHLTLRNWHGVGKGRKAAGSSAPPRCEEAAL